MNSPPRQREVSWIFDKRYWRVIAVLLTLVFLGYFVAGTLGAFVGPKPMFHNHIGPTRGFFPQWQYDGFFDASDGSMAYVDVELNIVVLLTPRPESGLASPRYEATKFGLIDRGVLVVERSAPNKLIFAHSEHEIVLLDVPAGKGLAVFEALQDSIVSMGLVEESVFPVVGSVFDGEISDRIENFALTIGN